MDTSKIVQENPSLRLSKKYVKKRKKEKEIEYLFHTKKMYKQKKVSRKKEVINI